MDCMPMIFETSCLTYDERLSIYCQDILGECKTSEVRMRFALYVERYVRRSGWKAVWSSTNSDTEDGPNFVVEVVNVIPQSILSEVNVSVPLVSNPPITFQEAQSLVYSRGNRIPLAELSPVFEGSGDLDQTALALEHVRFFYENIWREWDLEEEEDNCYISCYLKDRLRLYYDIKQNNLSEEFIRKYNDTITEYKQKMATFKQLRTNMSASDSEQELDASDVYLLAQKTRELDAIIRTLQTMEDPQMRYLLHSMDAEENPAVGKQRRTYLVTMFVSEILAAKMVKTLPDETIIEHYKTLEEAIECSISDDKIVICNGSYSIRALTLDHPLFISGNNHVILLSDEDENCFTTRTSLVKIEGIQIVQSSCNAAILDVESGKIVLKDCEFRGHHEGIIVRQGAHLIMEDCRVYCTTAVVIEENATVEMRRCEISFRDERRNTTGLKIYLSATNPALVRVLGCRILTDGAIVGLGCDFSKMLDRQSTDDGVRLHWENNSYEYRTLENAHIL